MSAPSQGLDLTFRDISPALVDLLAQRRRVIEDWERLPAEERLDDHLQAQFQQQLAFSDEAVAVYLKAEVQKVDGCASVLLWLESQEATAKAEEARLYNRRKHTEMDREYLERSVVWAMESAGKREIVGQRHTLKLKRNPPAVDDQMTVDLVPARFKKYELVVDGEELADILERHDDEEHARELARRAKLVGFKKAEIAKQIKAPEVCPDCKGEELVCLRCNGARTIPGSVPGCRMVQRDRLVVE